MTPDDITPEATRVIIHREAPGLAEALRAESVKHTPLGILTRGVAGIAESTLIVNFPGSPQARSSSSSPSSPRCSSTRCRRCAGTPAMATAAPAAS